MCVFLFNCFFSMVREDELSNFFFGFRVEDERDAVALLSMNTASSSSISTHSSEFFSSFLIWEVCQAGLDLFSALVGYI